MDAGHDSLSDLLGAGSSRDYSGTDRDGDDAGAGAAVEVPHYCMPNFTSILPTYSNSDQDYIKQAFSAGSWVSITRGLPVDVRGGLGKARQENMESAVSSSVLKPAVPVQKKKEVFSEFEYIPSRFSLAAEEASKERLESEAKRLAIAGKDWVCSSAATHGKYEDSFGDKEFRYPYLADPYAAAQDQLLRAKWIEDSKILHGPFLPSGKDPSGSITRALLPAVLKELHKVVDEDWGDYVFSVLSTEDDMIVVRFEMDTVDSERGLQAYMNVLASTGDIVMQYNLKKVVEDWHAQPGDGYLYYMFRPPWVRARQTDAFFTLHPEERNFTTSLAATLKPEVAVGR